MVDAQHARSATWTAEGQEKREAVKQMFAEIAPTYDICNGLMSLSLHHRWRSYAVSLLQLMPGDSVLDVCCGTGDFLPAVREKIGSAGRVVGIDFCAPMIERARPKHPSLLSLGDACRLPIASNSFSAVTVGWGIRNVPDIDAAHWEIARVLKPGGRFVSLDMSRPRGKALAALSSWTFNTLVPLLGTIFRQRKAYTYLPKSTAKFMSREELKQSMERAGFVDVRHYDLFMGNICVHFGRKP
jgi:demethylmenaquinone methyltransferase/2-methoxy-6-polyprenyl-1,4-benzoquinol methylase